MLVHRTNDPQQENTRQANYQTKPGIIVRTECSGRTLGFVDKHSLDYKQIVIQRNDRMNQGR